ncbi:hypothetical protein LAZ67_5003332 [Cordylochernes scorpioides]|uniref:Integrase p58-like C-terminal domain-containing protein n=1 Tax=Cordylochernes scorpioides TaxID=51811 RepID=A0ABY6KH82_9ARAC|nr:hypothetical protein LAZ67_5003332 [Cordylochernes scorpioides]
MMTLAYGEATLDRSNVYRWYKMFSEGREDVNDEERAGRPSTSTTDEKINEVEKMILANRRITVREVAEDLNISIGSCHSIFINDLGMRRVTAKFLPKLLNCDQKQHRMNIANEMLDSVRDDPNLLQRVITGDEAIRKKRPDLWKNKNWLLHHDNAPAHTSLLVRDFLAKNNTLMMPQPPYSPDLAPCDFFLFPKLKRPMKGRRYATLDEIKTASKEELKNILKNDFLKFVALTRKQRHLATEIGLGLPHPLSRECNRPAAGRMDSPSTHRPIRGVKRQECIEEYKRYVKKKKSEVKTEKSNENKITQEQFDENILKYFIHSMIPLRAVEDPYFSKIFTDLEISEMGLTLMSRRSLGRRIENHYETQVAKIKSKLKEASYVCTEIDIWSSKKRSFIGVTAHWITNDLRRVSVALACQRFKGVHSYNRLSDIIQEINDHFDLNTNKIVASVTDNGSNFVKTFKMFGVKLTNINIVDEVMPDSQPTEAFSESDVEDDESSNLEDPEHLLPAHLRCCAHTLSLCATTDANKLLSEQDTPLSQMHATIMKKCNALWKAAGRPKSAEIMQNVLGHTLSRPGETRWNSLFDALQPIFDIKEKSLLLHRLLNIKNAIKDNEFEYIQKYLTCTSPVAEALDILQSETNAYYGIVLPGLLALRRKLLKIEKKNNFSFCNPLVKAYRESVEKRFEKMLDVTPPEAEIAAIAALSHPRFKNKWLTCFEPADRTKILKVFKTCISEKISGNIVATVATTKTKHSTTPLVRLSKEGNSYSVIVKKLKAEGLDVGKATICRVVNGIGKKREAESNGQKFQVDRPRPVRTPATVSKVKRLATTENPPSQRQLSRMCGTSLKTINNIIHKDLELDTRRKGKVHKLTPFHMKNRATNARKLYEEHLAGSRSEYTATLDEAWMYVTYCNGIRKICYIKRGNQVPDNWVHQCSETFPKGFMVVGVMTGRGVLPLIKVPSKVKVNSEFYIECVLKPVIEQLKDLYPGEMDKVFLHHDKASSHTSNKTQQFLQEMKDTLGLNFIRNSDIPVKSPDASPLDFYGFGMLKQRLFNRRPKTEAGLWKAAQEEWSNVSLSKVKEVFAAWKVRCREIAKKKGKHIEHMKKIHVCQAIGEAIFLSVPIALGFSMLQGQTLQVVVGYSEKLMRRYFGPYKVTRKISDVTYEVETFGNQQGRRKTKDLVHICMMKPYLNPEDQEDQLEEDPEDDSTNFQEEDIPTERTQQPQTREEISGPTPRIRVAMNISPAATPSASRKNGGAMAGVTAETTLMKLVVDIPTGIVIMKQRVVIEFLEMEGASEIHKGLKNVYKEATIDISNVRRWMKGFLSGETSLDDKPRRGRPSTNPENEDKVDVLIRHDRRITFRELCNILNVGSDGIETMA